MLTERFLSCIPIIQVLKYCYETEVFRMFFEVKSSTAIEEEKNKCLTLWVCVAGQQPATDNDQMFEQVNK